MSTLDTPAPHAVVLMSGGIDSTTAAYYMASQGYVIHGLSVKYGQHAEREIECAKWHCDRMAEDHKVVDLSPLGTLLQSRLTTGTIDTSLNVSYNDIGTPSPCIVPFRNAVLLSIATGYAEAIGARTVVIGVVQEDHANFPDTTPAFLQAFQLTIEAGSPPNTAPSLCTPLVGTRKADVIRLGLRLGINYDQTYSCYNAGPLPCKVCESCIERADAFAEATGRIVPRDTGGATQS